ncbi:hypothetical protein RFI_07607, partial [Reticulomyxa filosa]
KKKKKKKKKKRAIFMDNALATIKETRLESSLLEKHRIQFSPDIPKSVIVFDADANAKMVQRFKQSNPDTVQDDLLLHCKVIAYNIYQKYVRVGCELSLLILDKKKKKDISCQIQYEMNISSRNRGTLRVLMDDKQQWMSGEYTINPGPPFEDGVTLKILSSIFDAALAENMGLLLTSFSRFQNTDEFESLLSLVKNNAAIQTTQEA